MHSGLCASHTHRRHGIPQTLQAWLAIRATRTAPASRPWFPAASGTVEASISDTRSAAGVAVHVHQS